MRAITILLALVLSACSSDDSSDAKKKDAGASGGGGGKDGGSGGSSLGGTGGSSGKDSASDAVTFDDGVPPVAKPAFLYVSVGGETRLAVLRLSETGTLTPHPELDLTLAHQPRALGWDAGHRRIYAGLSNGDIATIAIDTAGKPSLAGND